MKKIFLTTLLLLSANFLFAGEYEDGLAALKKKEYKQALGLFETASANGDARADEVLGQMYIYGVGVDRNVDKAVTMLEKSAKNNAIGAKITLAKFYLGFADKNDKKDIAKARTLARECAKADSAEGMYLVFVAFAIDPELNYIENGKADINKYETLRKRSIKDRALDIEAYDMLMRSARKNYFPAIMLLGTSYHESIGENNNEKALKIIRAVSASVTSLENIKKQLEFMAKIGSTRTTFKLLSDAQVNAMTAAMVIAYGTKKPDECDVKSIKMLKADRDGEIEGAEYLPLKEVGMEKALLLGGKWREKWTYNVCGKEVVVPIDFNADGNKGAFFHIQLGVKN